MFAPSRRLRHPDLRSLADEEPGDATRGTADVGVPGGLTGVSAVMVTDEPDGGTLAPTSAPVIAARL